MGWSDRQAEDKIQDQLFPKKKLPKKTWEDIRKEYLHSSKARITFGEWLEENYKPPTKIK